jgi:hypothetical protein
MSISPVTIENADNEVLNFSLERLHCDLNQNGETDLADAVQCLQAISDSDSSVVFSPETDVDQDGRLGLVEAIFILQSLSLMR